VLYNSRFYQRDRTCTDAATAHSSSSFETLRSADRRTKAADLAIATFARQFDREQMPSLASARGTLS
jgi:hypothetical protein